MARFVGVDVGETAIKLAELDGSYRKTRLLRWRVEPLPPELEGAARAEAIAAALQRGLSEGKFGGDPVLGHPGREAVLRTIEVPFTGTEQIRKVLKSELEGAIFSHSVDDMVVDFHEIGKGIEGTRILVAAVPKAGLRVQLAALERHRIEPERVDLDTMALYRAAHWCGAFEVAEDAAALPAPAGGAVALPLTAVVDLGAGSSRVLLVEGENLVDMRTLRLGDAAIADELARKHAIPIGVAREAVRACLTTGSDYRAEIPATELVVADEGGTDKPAVPAHSFVVEHADVEAAQTAFLQRLARELVRFLTATGRSGRFQALWLTGGASRGPGIAEMLTEVFGVAPKPLDILGHLAHDLDAEETEAANAGAATAVGLALAGLGGPEGFDLRQEDLAYTRGFDRVKFPLAITCMLAVFAAVALGVKFSNDLKNLEFHLGRTYAAGKSDPKGPQFYGMLHQVLATKWFENPQYFQLESKGKNYGYRELIAQLHETTDVTRRLPLVAQKLRQVVEQKQESSGIYEDVKLESGLAVLVRWAEVMKRAEPTIGRYLMFRVDLKMKNSNSRSLDFLIAFRGGDDTTLRARGEQLKAEFVEEIKNPDSPFAAIEEPKESIPADSKEVGVPCIYFDFSLKLKDEFEPFGGGRVGMVEGLPSRMPGLLAGGEEVRK